MGAGQIKRAQTHRNRQAASKKSVLLLKKAGKGLFAPKTLSAEMAAICGGKKMARTEGTKKIWADIKSNKLNAGRIITTDAKLKAIFPVAKIDMLKMPAYVSKHLS